MRRNMIYGLKSRMVEEFILLKLWDDLDGNENI